METTPAKRTKSWAKHRRNRRNRRTRRVLARAAADPSFKINLERINTELPEAKHWLEREVPRVPSPSPPTYSPVSSPEPDLPLEFVPEDLETHASPPSPRPISPSCNESPRSPSPPVIEIEDSPAPSPSRSPIHESPRSPSPPIIELGDSPLPSPSPPPSDDDLPPHPYRNLLDYCLNTFPPYTDPLPEDAFTIGLGRVNLADLKKVLIESPPDTAIPCFHPSRRYPVAVPIQFFWKIYKPSTVQFEELP